MDESDDDFTELCAKLLRRVKRNATEGDGKASGRGPHNGTKSTAAKTRSKKPKPTTKGKNQDGATRKKGGHSPELGDQHEGTRIELGRTGGDKQTGGRRAMHARGEEAPGVSLLACHGGNEQQRPQLAAGGGIGSRQIAAVCPYAGNIGATCAGDILVEDAVPHAVIQTAPAVGFEPQVDMEADPADCVQSQWDTEAAETKSVQPRVDMEMDTAEGARARVDIYPAAAEDVFPQASMEMAPTDVILRQDAVKTAPTEVAWPRVVERVLERMQQFKRSDPKRMKHSAEERPTATTDGGVLQLDQLVNETRPALPVLENDRALALALQCETSGQDKEASLEEEGFYFCQLCQKDLSAMNSTLRQQHMNRCLDEVETSTEPVPVSVAPRIQECPICGKQFSTAKSRAAHLKRCAVTMQVPPQLLLQAVQMQTSGSRDSLPTMSSSTAGRAKRKGSAKETEPPKKHKPNMESSKVEDMLVALVMSRSLLEQESQNGVPGVTVANGRSKVNLPVMTKPGAEKKSRKKKKKEVPPPPLLVQNPETAIKQIQNRVAALLMEEMELPCTPALPASRFWEDDDLGADWRHSLPGGNCGILWERSAMTDTPPLEFFYTKELMPPISAWTAPQNQKTLGTLPLAVCDGQQQVLQAQPSNDSLDPGTQVVLRSKTDDRASQGSLSQRYQISSCSQQDQEALQDLMDLAGEGLTLTQWNLGTDQKPSVEGSGKQSVVSDIAPSGFVPSPKENWKRRRSSYHRSLLPLGTLAADFGQMVNNPHLSDVQFQMDCGDVLYAHQFVLYSRCPRLVELVHDEGFLVEEDGDARSRRVLLNDVTSEAARAFLQYLYCASTDISPCCLSDVAALSIRFGVSELLSICENSHLGDPVTDGMDSEDELFSDGKEENDGDSRAENFQELLKSMWLDEDEEVLAELEAERLEEDDCVQDNEKVDEDELEEIYEFAATQRKADLDPSEEDTEGCLESENEDDQDPQHQMGYRGKHLEPALRSKGEEMHEYLDDMVHLQSSQLESIGKEARLRDVTIHKSVNLEGTQPTQSRCSNITGSDVCKGKGTLEEAQERLDGHKLTLSFQVFGEDEVRDSLKEPSPSQDSHVGLDDSYDRMFSDTCGEYVEPSQVDHKKSDLGLIIAEKCGELSKSSLLMDGLHETLPFEVNHCRSPLVSQCSRVLPALGLSPASHKTNRTPQLKAHPQSQSSPFATPEPGRSRTSLFTISPQGQCLPFPSPELGSSRTQPSKGSPQNQHSPFPSPELGSSRTPPYKGYSQYEHSPFPSPEPCKNRTQMFQVSPRCQRLSFSYPEPGRSKFVVPPQNQQSPFSSPKPVKNKGNGALFSSADMSELKTDMMGSACNYEKKKKQDMKVELLSPAKSPSGDLSKQNHNSLISSFSVGLQKPSSLAEKNDIIVLLDSDEEMELERHPKESPRYSPWDMKEKPLASSASDIEKVEKSSKSMKSEAVSVIDCDMGESLSGPASVTRSDVNSSPDGCSSSRLKLQLSCGDDHSHEETCSSMDTSWLVPATPFINKSRDCSSQTTSFQYLSKLSQIYKPSFEASSVDGHGSTLVNNLSTNMSKATSNLSLRTSPSAGLVEENSSDPSFGTPPSANVAAENSRNKETLPGSPMQSSPIKSLHFSPIPPTQRLHRSSATASKSPERPCSPAQVLPAKQSLQKEPSSSSVFEVEDSQDDQTVYPVPSSGSLQMDFELPIPVDDECWNVEYPTPAEKDKQATDEQGFANTTNHISGVRDAESDRGKSPNKCMDRTVNGHVNKSSCQNSSTLPEHETTPQQARPSQNSRLSFLNSNLWEEWDGEEDNLPEILPLSQRLSNMSAPESIPKLKTPVAAICKRNLVPEVPITPLPSYSDMDTPKLKKELDRFGVRPLPKRQMVLKLKEIFQYTHQTMSSDSEEEIPTSQLQVRVSSVCLSQPTPAMSTPQQGRSSTASFMKRKPGISSQPPSDSGSEGPARTSHRRFKKPTQSKKTSSTATTKKQAATLSLAKSPLKDRLPGITASQESTASSATGSDVSFGSQSSSTNEFETAFASGEEEEEESVTASQAAVREEDKAEAVRHYLRLNPDLYQKILLYEPIELAGLQAELKQNGIKMPMGKLLDFLDAHCITFTTAGARKEKQEKKQQRQGKKKVRGKRH